MHILVAVDGSKNSMGAARYAALLLENISGGSATLLYVYNVRDKIKSKGVELPVGIPSLHEGVKQKAKLYRGSLPENFSNLSNSELSNALITVEKVFKDKDIKYKTKVLEGYDVAEEISDFAEKNKVDQIVIGTRGRSGVKGVIMGSVTHKLIQIAPCPLLLVK